MYRKHVIRVATKTLVLSLPVMVGFAVVLFIAGRILFSQGDELLGQSEERRIEVEAALIRNHLEKAVSDLRFMANGHAMSTWLADPSPEQLNMLRHDLLQLVREKHIYLQARLLGVDGMELARVDADSPGHAVLRPVDELQLKSHRPYFTGAMSLAKDEVFISRLDLNEEGGKVEEPFRSTIRISVPLFDASGVRRGVLVFNLQGKVILGGLKIMRGEGGAWGVLLADEDGYWMIGPSPELEWGFQIPARAVMTMASLYPRAWEIIGLQDSGRIFTENGLFIFTSIYPNEIVWKPTFSDDNNERSMERLRKTRWILAARLPADHVERAASSVSFPLFVAFGVGSIIILVYALILALAHNRLQLARRKEVNQSMALAESVMNLQELIEVNDRNMVQLRDANSRLESVLSAASYVSVIATDDLGIITLFNRGAENMLGYSAEEVVGIKTPEIIHVREEMVQRGKELTDELGYPVAGFDVFVETARKGGVESREWTYVRKDGSLLNVELVVTPIVNETDGVKGFLGIAVDVTERNAALRELESSTARLNSIVETAADGVFTVDLGGIVTSVNSAGAAIFGFVPEELVGQKVNMLMDEPHRTLHDRYIAHFLTSGKANVIGETGREVPGLHRNGGTIPLELSISEVQTETEHFFTGIVRDISKRKLAEEALRQANEALMEKQRVLDDDMIAAAQIQRSLLPQRAPNASGFIMDWLFLPSTHVGGDVFNILPLPGGKMGLYLIDVSGHGPAAAMVTVSISQVLQVGSEFIEENNVALVPDEVLRRVDRAFPMERFDRFSTMFYMSYDPAKRTLCCSGAGHPPPLLARPGQSVIRLDKGGTVIGMGEPVPFVSQQVEVKADDVLLLYTDGCSEHADPAGEQYGISRLEKALVERIHLNPDTILKELQDELDRFGEGAKPDDDISLVCLKFIDD